MNSLQKKLVSGALIVATLCLAVAFSSHAQNHGTPGQASSTSTSEASLDAERAQIWNSPNMLRARAWLQDYCSTSAKVTPEDAQKFMSELQNMTPVQMKLWLMKFDEEEDQKAQQRALWSQAHSAALAQ